MSVRVETPSLIAASHSVLLSPATVVTVTLTRGSGATGGGSQSPGCRTPFTGKAPSRSSRNPQAIQ